MNEDLRTWFKQKWVRMDTKGNIRGQCAREPGEGKPKCLPLAKARAMDKEDRAAATTRKRREDPIADRSGKGNAPVNVRTEQSGAGFEGTTKLANKYKKDTPGQETRMKEAFGYDKYVKNYQKITGKTPDQKVKELEDFQKKLAQQKSEFEARHKKDSSTTSEEMKKEDPPFIPSKPSKPVTPGKYGQEVSKVRHLARMALKKKKEQGVAEEVELDEMDKSQPSSSRGAEGLPVGKKADPVKTDKVKSDALKVLQKQYKKVNESSYNDDDNYAIHPETGKVMGSWSTRDSRVNAVRTQQHKEKGHTVTSGRKLNYAEYAKSKSNITELNKTTINKYIDKAVTSHDMLNVARRNTTGDEQKELARKEAQRKQGISRAVNRQDRQTQTEENKPSHPELWSKAKALAKSKFDVYPSAYANGWAAKWYKSKGGKWSASESVDVKRFKNFIG